MKNLSISPYGSSRQAGLSQAAESPCVCPEAFPEEAAIGAKSASLPKRFQPAHHLDNVLLTRFVKGIRIRDRRVICSRDFLPVHGEG